MEMNWDYIKYIFQIPRDWFRYIHRKIHNAYGTLFIRVLDGEYGGMKIDIDKQVFKETVEDAIDLDSYVKTVNDIGPDENGNVDLDANFLEASDITTPGIVVGTDYQGEQTVCSPNHKHKAKDVEGAVKTVNGTPPDENGNVEVLVGVRTVNEIEPDENGNIDLGPIVNSVNGHEPDENGNVEFSVVEKVDGVEPVNGNVSLGAIRSINNTIRPVNGNVDLTNVFASAQHEHPHTQISDWNQATSSFLEASDITSPGIVVGTDYDDPDHPVCSPNHKHKVKDIVNDDELGFVTINTEQEITASKKFTNGANLSVENSDVEGVFIKPTGNMLISGTNNSYFRMNIAGGDPNISPFQIVQQLQNGQVTTHITQITGHLSLACQSQGSVINMYKEQIVLESSQRSIVQVGDDGIILQSNNENQIDVSNYMIDLKVKENCIVLLTADANNAMLSKQPTQTNEDSLAIATCGYVQKNAITLPEGKTPITQDVTIVSDVTWDGTRIVVNKKKLEFSKGVLTAVTNLATSYINTVAYNAN